MLRQAPGRNQRAKGFRLKHALQMGILVAICIWLLYQVKHSHEKRRAYDAHNTKAINKPIENQEDFFDFGRKDLTRTEEAGTVSEIHKEEESEETQEVVEPEIKQEETEDEVRGAGDDGIDEHDQENADEETENVEDSTDEEKEGQMDETDRLDSQDHEAGTQAREENYKRDDASSAVVHDTRASESDTVTVNGRSMDEEKIVDDSKGDDSTSEGYKVDLAKENLETQEMGIENMVNRTSEGYKVDLAKENLETQEMGIENMVNRTVYGSESGDNGTIVGSMNNRLDDVKDKDTLPDYNHANNATAADSKEAEDENSKSENGFVTNSTIVEEKIQIDSLINNTTAAESNNLTELSANSTANISDRQTEAQTNSTVEELPSGVQMSNTTVDLDSARDQNMTVDIETLEDVDSNSENIVNRDEKSNPTAALDSGEQSMSSSTDGNEDAGERETDDLSHAVIEEEQETRMDLSTLPNIEDEANSMEDEAAE